MLLPTKSNSIPKPELRFDVPELVTTDHCALEYERVPGVQVGQLAHEKLEKYSNRRFR